MTPSRFGRINRRRFVASSAIGGGAILTAGQLPPVGNRSLAPAVLAQDSSADVPTFRGNAARTGEMPGPGPDDSNGVEVIWEFANGGWFYSSPAVVDGVVYVGSEDGHLYAVDAKEGSERWRFATDGPVKSSPAVVDGVVYTSGGKNLYAVNVNDGTERWRFDMDLVDTSSPAVVDGVAYIIGGKNLYAVDADDGTERWRFDVDLVGVNYSTETVAVTDDVVYTWSHLFGRRSERSVELYLHSLNAEDGTERWRFELENLVYTPPAVADGVVYVSVPGLLYALNASDGTELWRLEDARAASFAVADGVVYVSGEDGVLYAVDAGDGTERWRFATDNLICFSPTVVDGVVYVSGMKGNLYAVNADDGTERWRVVTGDKSGSPPVVADGMVYIGGSDGAHLSEVALYAIGARVPRLVAGGTARVKEKTPLRGGPASTAVERAELKSDTVVTITGEAETTGDIKWWPVTVGSTGDQGWVVASALEPLTSGPEPTATA